MTPGNLKRKAASARRIVLVTAGIVIGGIFVPTIFGGQYRSVSAQVPPPASQTAPKNGAVTADTSEDPLARSKEILAHLNAALRLYRDSQAPIQKVGEPSDLLYRDQAVTLASQIAAFAFQSAKAEALLMAKAQPASQAATAGESQSQRLQTTRTNVEQQVAQLKAQNAAIQEQLAIAKPKQAAALQQQKERVEGELELQAAMGDALGKIVSVSGSASEGGFAAQIEQLERTAPGLTNSKLNAAAPALDNLSAERSSGVTSQAGALFQLLGARQDIDNLVAETDSLKQQATALRTPLIATLKDTIAQGQALSQPAEAQAPAVNAAAPVAAAVETAAATRKSFDQLTTSFKALSGAAVPLSQETVTLEEDRASLQAWRVAVNNEYISILRSLLLRVGAIAVALLVIFILGEVWRRATTRYVRDVRRRRQLLVLRRLAVGFLSGIVLIFGLVTQFSSLATFAGFITAGLAVGLQTILLSVAAYFFIIGRYGVKVGDRITITGVTGDVIEVGLVRFYMLEMAGSGTDLYPTGRVAVFSNAVLFQAGTPLYKQMPGTEYAWHELTVKLSPDADYRAAVDEILKAVQKVYESYKSAIDKQHKNLESWMDSSIDAPDIQSNLQLVDGGPQLWIRYPVTLSESASIDGKMGESLLRLIAGNPAIKTAVSGAPIIRAAVKG